MPLPKSIQKQTTALSKQFDKCMNKLERLYDIGRYDEYLTLREGELNMIYKDACSLVREAGAKNAPYRADLLDAIQPITDEAIVENGIVDLGCLTLRAQDYRDEPIVIEDRRITQNPTARAPGDEDEDHDTKPHPRSSPYAIFSFNPSNLTATPSNHSAMPIYDVRCEIASVRDHKDRHLERCKIDHVIDVQISNGGSRLAVLGWVETKVLQPRHRKRQGKFPAP
ncbi:hypothetical protein B0J17DRAFT_721887 [Rhizoctonia solani]|nr:hypothetical protein B0J17DRAFT_721887 [Rhizoctonia solani]